MTDALRGYVKEINRHGTRCAGEVAATANNGHCVPGVAYNAKGMEKKIFFYVFIEGLKITNSRFYLAPFLIKQYDTVG